MARAKTPACRRLHRRAISLTQLNALLRELGCAHGLYRDPHRVELGEGSGRSQRGLSTVQAMMVTFRKKERDELGALISDCGNYRIWIQARPLHESAYWAVQFRDEPWITETADGKNDAIRIACEHAAKREAKR